MCIHFFPEKSFVFTKFPICAYIPNLWEKIIFKRGGGVETSTCARKYNETHKFRTNNHQHFSFHILYNISNQFCTRLAFEAFILLKYLNVG